jgi:molybdopterin/thiamine biosynthesis adenylyltransferase
MVNKILMIGCGGVGSYLLRPLMLTFPKATLELWDGDVFEEKNLERQVFQEKQVGMHKVQALVSNQPNAINQRIRPVPSYFLEGAEALDGPPDCVVCCADNNNARKEALVYGTFLGVPVFVGANETFDSQAWVWHKELCNWDIQKKFKAMFAAKPDGPGVGCVAQLDTTPQLACANFSAASLVLGLMWRWFMEYKPAVDGEFHETYPAILTLTAYGAERFPD